MAVTSPIILPSALHQYLTAISVGDLDDALRHTSPDVASALPTVRGPRRDLGAPAADRPRSAPTRPAGQPR